MPPLYNKKAIFAPEHRKLVRKPGATSQSLDDLTQSRAANIEARSNENSRHPEHKYYYAAQVGTYRLDSSRQQRDIQRQGTS